jgi:DNA polymerase-3 subunit epsilon
MSMLRGPLAIVDLETTGSDPARDRVTEIGVLEVDRFERRATWSTLVNPGRRIPSPIEALTGISNDMVAAAPRFAEVAGELHERLAGRVFVAHNARFDYGFLRREFDRVGIRFMAKTLCTVRLSRRLYRQHRGHDLDSLIERHGLACPARHRAVGDAEAVWDFLRLAAREHGDEVLGVAARQVARQPALPPQLDRAAVDEVPEAPGVYILYGEAGAPLYVGMSKAMRSRVLQHFIAAAPWAAAVRRIEWQRTAGELGAALREAELVKRLAPAHNRLLRKPDAVCGFAFDMRRLRLARAHEIDADTMPYLYGLFRSRQAALQTLRTLADEHRLCLHALGFEKGRCFRHQVGRCAGVCAGKESVHVHLARVATALARLRTLAWPHGGAVGIIERDRSREATEIHVVDRWCYLGTARSDGELAELAASPPAARFDYDHYRIVARHLARGKAHTVPLELPCTAS